MPRHFAAPCVSALSHHAQHHRTSRHHALSASAFGRNDDAGPARHMAIPRRSHRRQPRRLKPVPPLFCCANSIDARCTRAAGAGAPGTIACPRTSGTPASSSAGCTDNAASHRTSRKGNRRGCHRRTGDSLSLGAELSETPARHAYGRSLRRRDQFRGAYLCVRARRQQRRTGLRQHRIAALGIRSQRTLPARDRQESAAAGLPYTVRVDKDDNIWATDKGSDMVKFNPQGQVEMVFGRKSELSVDCGRNGGLGWGQGCASLRRPLPTCGRTPFRPDPAD